MSLIAALLLQVGPNPVAPAPGAEEEILNRPRRDALAEETANPTSAWLARCLNQLEEDPSRAHTQAQIRRNETSGADRVVANHCLGLASTELGLWQDARDAFWAARKETPMDEPQTRARFGIMAGNAALAGANAKDAEALLAEAQDDAARAASAPLQAVAASDQARALVALNQPEAALALLETSTQMLPQRDEGWLLKATLLRRLDRLDEAQAAIERAVDLAPNNAQAGLEAGVIAVLSGRDDAARESWQSVIETQPDSLAAQTAKDYLAQLGPAPDPQEPATP